MQRSSARRRISNRAPLAAIELRPPSQPEERSRVALILVVFMRVTAVVWLFEGLVQWNSVLVTSVDGRSGLVYLTTPAIIAVVFFGIIDLIAAIGLWLATPWGGVIWLVTAGAQLFVIVVMPGFYDHPVLTGLVAVALVGLYLALTWRVARGAEAASRPR